MKFHRVNCMASIENGELKITSAMLQEQEAEGQVANQIQNEWSDIAPVPFTFEDGKITIARQDVANLIPPEDIHENHYVECVVTIEGTGVDVEGKDDNGGPYIWSEHEEK